MVTRVICEANWFPRASVAHNASSYCFPGFQIACIRDGDQEVLLVYGWFYFQVTIQYPLYMLSVFLGSVDSDHTATNILTFSIIQASQVYPVISEPSRLGCGEQTLVMVLGVSSGLFKRQFHWKAVWASTSPRWPVGNLQPFVVYHGHADPGLTFHSSLKRYSFV